jgi:hypothetical protein
VIKLCAAVVLMLCTAAASAAQDAMAPTHTSDHSPKHFRLTFVLTYPQQAQAGQSIVLDVPVSSDRPGTSSMTLAAGLTGQEEGSVEQNLQCTEVHESKTGLAAKVVFTMNRVLEPLPNSTEPLHRQLTFDRQIDLPLDQPTLITQEMHIKPLGGGDPSPSNNTPPAPPQITVTVTKL